MTEEENLERILAKALEMMRPAYLTREQLAKELNLSRPSIKGLELQGLPVHHLGGNTYRFLRAEVDAWIAAHPSKQEEGAA